MHEDVSGPISERYPNLHWALGSDIPLSDLEIKNELLQIIDEKIGSVRGLGCVGILTKVREGFQDFNDRTAYTLLSELEVAELFLERGHQVNLLPDNYFSGPSPDLLVTTRQGPLFVEVTHISTSDPGSLLIERIREITAQYPYLINFTFNAEISSPHHNHIDRARQEQQLAESLLQFSEHLRNISPNLIPVHGRTDVFTYEISDIHPSGRGYPCVLTSTVMISLDHSYSYLTMRLEKKAEKRARFPSTEQKTPYIIAIVCDDPGIDPYEVKELLYGSTASFGLSQDTPESIRWRERHWTRIIEELHGLASWQAIQRAQELGWGELLIDTNLIPHDYCYVKESGLFLSMDVMRWVSGVLFFNWARRNRFFANPFSIDSEEGPFFLNNLQL